MRTHYYFNDIKVRKDSTQTRQRELRVYFLFASEQETKEFMHTCEAGYYLRGDLWI